MRNLSRTYAKPDYWFDRAVRDFNHQCDWAGYLALFYWVESLPIYSCDDLGLCNGPSKKHDCVDCPSKRC